LEAQTAPTNQPQEPSDRMLKLRALAARAAALNEGILKERVAVPDPFGGYAIVVRETNVDSH
jgi:hypothetical protein